MILRLLKVAVLLAGLLYLAVVALAYTFQDALMFPAQPLAPGEIEGFAAANGLQVFDVQTADGVRIRGLHRPAGGRRALIFHHGNAGGLLATAWLGDALPGVDVFTFSYRGYPGSEEAPKTEVGLIQDARAVWDHVTGEVGIPPERVVLQGQSLGGGVVHGLLMEVRPAAVVLDSTFTSAVDVAREAYPFLPVDLLFRHRFPSAERAPGVQVPVLVLHGTDDDLVPFAHAERLVELLPDARLHPVPGWGHGHWLLDDRDARATYQRFVEDHLR